MLRSDRTDTPLTLLVFDLQSAGRRTLAGDGKELERLASIVCECTRRTDIKGWFRDGHRLRVGLLLHNTTHENAERILSCVRQRFAGAPRAGNGNGNGNGKSNGNGNGGHGPLTVACEIYAYPSGRTVVSDGKWEQALLFDDETLAGLNGPGAPQDPRSRGPKTGQGAAPSLPEALAPGNPAAASIDELLAGPIPLWKRLMDVCVAAAALVVLSPVFVLVALAIRLTSRGPVFFKQERIGYLGKPFPLWKFRSMRENADATVHRKYLSRLITGKGNSADAPMLKMDRANPQITAVGRFLRLTCIDELPQMVNVLRGEMSLVGPRPCLPYEVEEYLLWHHRRFDSIPGITGLWQVSGKNRTTFRQMIRYDIYYARHRSLRLDLWILLRTIPAIFREIRSSLSGESAKAENETAGVLEDV
jgi:lipopolysaccharide/colanic/teichoic acid biosynthesis glycosyltransferase